MHPTDLPAIDRRSQHRFRIVSDKAGMHFDRDLHAMVRRELAMLLPVRSDLASHCHLSRSRYSGGQGQVTQFGYLRFVAVAGTAGEIDHHRHAEPARQFHRLAAHFPMSLRDVAVGMQRVSVAAQRADGEAVVVQLLLEFLERRRVFEHRELAVRIAGIVARTKFNRRDAEAFSFRDYIVQRQLR